ncbi:MAG: DUF6502 family protein, partial [Burkholderiales bacterium]
LLPLVRLMLTRGLHYPAAAEMLKSLYIEIADREFALDKKRQTDSRVSLLTGVHRKDVKRLRHAPPDSKSAAPPDVSLGSQVIAAWNANPDYVDEEGLPKPLARFAQDGGEKSFETLVKRISTDMHPRALLDEWLRSGIATLNEQSQVCLQADAFIPEEGYAEKIFYFGHDLHDHAAAIAHNLSGGRPSMLERCVHYDGLDADAVDKISEAAVKLGMRALRGVNARAAEALAATRDSLPARRTRMTFGVYFYQEPQEEPLAAPAEQTA